jgi:hypothetical protein
MCRGKMQQHVAYKILNKILNHSIKCPRIIVQYKKWHVHGKCIPIIKIRSEYGRAGMKFEARATSNVSKLILKLKFVFLQKHTHTHTGADA